MLEKIKDFVEDYKPEIQTAIGCGAYFGFCYTLGKAVFAAGHNHGYATAVADVNDRLIKTLENTNKLVQGDQ